MNRKSKCITFCLLIALFLNLLASNINAIDIPEQSAKTEVAEASETTPSDKAYQKTLVTSINSSSDDCLVSNNSVNLTSSGVYLHGLYTNNIHYDNYLRFTNIALPEDAVIQKAYLTFTTRDASTKSSTMNIYGEIGSGVAFQNQVHSFLERIFSNVVIESSTPTALRVNETFTTSDLSSLVSEMQQNNGGSGNYVFKIEGNDEGSAIMRSFNSNASMAPKLVIEYASDYGTYTSQLTTKSDNAEEYGTNHAIDLGGSGLEIGGYYSTSLTAGYKLVTGLRFDGVELPEGAQIDDAYIEFTTYATNSKDIVSHQTIKAELKNAPTYAKTAYNVSQRTYGTMQVTYEQAALKTRGSVFRTANLSTLIEENRANGWTSGSALGFMIDGDNYIGSVYQAGTANAPKLVITYSNPSLHDKGEVGEDYQPAAIQNIFINEVSGGTALAKEPWVELYNANDFDVTLAHGVFLSDSTTTYEFDKFVIPAHGFRTINLDAIGFHFQNQETTLTLTTATTTIDQFAYATSESNETYGRFRDADSTIVKFTNGSYRTTNNYAVPVIDVAVDYAAGQYNEAINVHVLSQDYNRIQYTIDGSAPKTNGLTYTGSIRIDQPRTLKLYVYNERTSEGVTTSYDYYIGETNQFTATLSAKADNAEEYGTKHVMDVGGSNLEIGGYYSTSLTDAYKVTTGLRFQDVHLPADVEILDAYIEFTSYATNTKNVVSNQIIKCELGNAEAYKNTTYNVSARNYGELAVTYPQASLKTRNEVFRTANLKDIIDEARLSGWQDGNALGFRIDGDNYIGNVYRAGTSGAPKLIIEYKYSGKGAFIEGAITKSEEMKNIYVNEVSAEGTIETLEDKASWIELYNDNDVPVILKDGVYLSDDKNDLEKHEFQNLIIPAKSYKIVLADERSDLGNTHLNFSISSSGTLYLSAKNAKGTTKSFDSLKYKKQLYNESYGRKSDGSDTLVGFVKSSYEASNQQGLEKYTVALNKERGLYDDSFEVTLDTSKNIVIRYTLDGSSPSETKGTVYTGPIRITQNSVVKYYGYDSEGNTGVQAHTYILKNNLRNETGWKFKTAITSEEYGQAMEDFPIVSVTSDKKFSSSINYAGTFEYLDSHVNANAKNFFSYAGFGLSGQWSAANQIYCGLNIKFKRSYGTKKAKYDFFDTYENDAYPVVSKFSELNLKEGEDGPQNNVWNLGYLRYDDKVSNDLLKEMQTFASTTRYVHYFLNGKYQGVRTLKERFGDNMSSEYFGGEDEDYTEVNFIDGNFKNGIVESGKGDASVWNAIKATLTAKDFQSFKQWVDIDNLIKTQIVFMFTDTENEMRGVVYNDAPNGGGSKMEIKINDTDGAFFNNGKSGTAATILAGGGGTYRYKWNTNTASRQGAGKMFATFSGDSKTNATAGNLEFKTLVKDAVLTYMGPASGDFSGSDDAPLSVANVTKMIRKNAKELDTSYKVESAFYGFNQNVYTSWLALQTTVENQLVDRVKFNLEQWRAYGMTHTLGHVEILEGEDGIRLQNPNENTVVYYTVDGSDPMGADGVVNEHARLYVEGAILQEETLTIRPFTTNNWGPKTIQQ